MPMIYKWSCPLTNRVYIGKHNTESINKRYGNLDADKFHNIFLSNDISTYGIDNLNCEILNRCKEEELNYYEFSYMIDEARKDPMIPKYIDIFLKNIQIIVESYKWNSFVWEDLKYSKSEIRELYEKDIYLRYVRKISFDKENIITLLKVFDILKKQDEKSINTFIYILYFKNFAEYYKIDKSKCNLFLCNLSKLFRRIIKNSNKIPDFEQSYMLHSNMYNMRFSYKDYKPRKVFKSKVSECRFNVIYILKDTSELVSDYKNSERHKILLNEWKEKAKINGDYIEKTLRSNITYDELYNFTKNFYYKWYTEELTKQRSSLLELWKTPEEYFESKFGSKKFYNLLNDIRKSEHKQGDLFYQNIGYSNSYLQIRITISYDPE